MTSLHLTEQQATCLRGFRAFADRELVPRAAEFDASQAISQDVVTALSDAGYLGSFVPREHGGLGLSMVEYGLLSEEIGRGCQSIRNFVAVQDMVIHSILSWGTADQRQRWLPAIMAGATCAAFALTESSAGSDASAVSTTATAQGGDVLLRGDKQWISFAQIADLFLVLARFEGKATAFLVERDAGGLEIEPLSGLLGLRGSMLGRITFDNCRIPATNMVGRPDMGLVFVASSALDLGRYSTAWGAVGLAQSCVTACVEYANKRVQHGTEIGNHQLVQRMLADMATDCLAARLLCHHAGVSKEQRDINAVHHTLMAKYRASTVATKTAADAVQLHGANGIGSELALQRHYRDAKVLEIIEGTSQIQQTLLGQFVVEATGQ
ncbi:acyl-CoA dehydrogenase family protein [Nocardia sp. NPDC051911]|uniref:acyl-CoA dehydrogenase family protein n=1 Tax=Nocardia sp. NPDC051911 TaxID=3154648 RepID=UPI003432F628